MLWIQFLFSSEKTFQKNLHQFRLFSTNSKIYFKFKLQKSFNVFTLFTSKNCYTIWALAQDISLSGYKASVVNPTNKLHYGYYGYWSPFSEWDTRQDFVGEHAIYSLASSGSTECQLHRNNSVLSELEILLTYMSTQLLWRVCHTAFIMAAQVQFGTFLHMLLVFWFIVVWTTILHQNVSTSVQNTFNTQNARTISRTALHRLKSLGKKPRQKVSNSINQPSNVFQPNQRKLMLWNQKSSKLFASHHSAKHGKNWTLISSCNFLRFFWFACILFHKVNKFLRSIELNFLNEHQVCRVW